MTHLERTDVAQQDFNRKTGEIPVTRTTRIMASDGEDHDLFRKNGAAMDPFKDTTPIEQTCNTENPEACEACD